MWVTTSAGRACHSRSTQVTSSGRSSVDGSGMPAPRRITTASLIAVAACSCATVQSLLAQRSPTCCWIGITRPEKMSTTETPRASRSSTRAWQARSSPVLTASQ